MGALTFLFSHSICFISKRPAQSLNEVLWLHLFTSHVPLNAPPERNLTRSLALCTLLHQVLPKIMSSKGKIVCVCSSKKWKIGKNTPKIIIKIHFNEGTREKQHWEGLKGWQITLLYLLFPSRWKSRFLKGLKLTENSLLLLIPEDLKLKFIAVDSWSIWMFPFLGA